MKLEVIKERETPLLSRTRITLKAEYEGATPSRLELKKLVADKIKADEKLVVLKHIYTRFGKNSAKIIAHIYQNEKDMQKLEHTKLLEKHFPKKKEEKAEAAPTEAAAEGEAKEGAGEKVAEEKQTEETPEQKPTEETPKEEKQPEAEEKPAEEEKTK